MPVSLVSVLARPRVSRSSFEDDSYKISANCGKVKSKSVSATTDHLCPNLEMLENYFDRGHVTGVSLLLIVAMFQLGRCGSEGAD